MNKNKDIVEINDESKSELPDMLTRVGQKLDEKHQESRADKKEKNGQNFIKTIAICITIVIVVLSGCLGIPRIITMLNGSLEKAIKIVKGTVTMPYSASEFKGRNANDVELWLYQCGFENVSFMDEENKTGIFHRKGTVKYVQIKGDHSFKKGAEFDNNTDSVIIYRYVNSQRINENRIAAFLALVICALSVSIIIVKKKRWQSYVAMMTAVAAIAGACFYIYYMDESDKTFAPFTASCKVNIIVTSPSEFFNNYDVYIFLADNNLGRIENGEENKCMYSSDIKKGSYMLTFFRSDDKKVKSAYQIDIDTDTDYYIELDKEKKTIKVEIKEAFPNDSQNESTK